MFNNDRKFTCAIFTVLYILTMRPKIKHQLRDDFIYL